MLGIAREVPEGYERWMWTAQKQTRRRDRDSSATQTHLEATRKEKWLERDYRVEFLELQGQPRREGPTGLGAGAKMDEGRRVWPDVEGGYFWREEIIKWPGGGWPETIEEEGCNVRK